MITNIRLAISTHRKRLISEEELTAAAVLIPMFEKNGEWHLLLTVRTDNVATHKGQISFPGGARDMEDESLLATALRESFEEVGIRPQDVTIIGELDDLITVTDFVVTPFVGTIPYPYQFTPSADEISELIEIPLSFFLDKQNERIEKREHRGRQVTVYYYDYGKYSVWGVTGRIIKGFMELLRA